MEITIRRGEPGDVEQVGSVLLSFYNMRDLVEAQEAYRRELEMGHRYIVAEYDGTIIGITSWFPHGVPHHGLAELDRIVVLPDARLNGAGRELFQGLVDDATRHYAAAGQQLRKLFLFSHDDNVAAHALYRKMGMEKEAVLQDHYYDGRAEAVFSRFFHRPASQP